MQLSIIAPGANRESSVTVGMGLPCGSRHEAQIDAQVPEYRGGEVGRTDAAVLDVVALAVGAADDLAARQAAAGKHHRHATMGSGMDCSNLTTRYAWTSLATRFWLTGWSASESTFRRTCAAKIRAFALARADPTKCTPERTDCLASALGGADTRRDGSEKSPRCAWRALIAWKCALGMRKRSS